MTPTKVQSSTSSLNTLSAPVEGVESNIAAANHSNMRIGLNLYGDADWDSRAEAKSISPHLFPGRGGGHRVDLKKPWPAICKAAEIEGLRVHDLRHSFASILVASGATLPMIGRLLGHTQVSTTQRHLDVDPLRALVAKVGAVVHGAEKVASEKAAKRSAKVVKMQERSR